MANYAMINKDTGAVENIICFDDHIYLIELSAENADIAIGGTVVNGVFTPKAEPPVEVPAENQ